MKLQAIIASAAFAAALTVSGAGFAQSMIGGAAIPADRLEEFKASCEALRAQSTASLTADDDAGDQVDEMATGSTGADTAQAESPDPAAQENWDQILAGLTLEQCDEGFPAAM
jgi:hypothetical protein